LNVVYESNLLKLFKVSPDQIFIEEPTLCLSFFNFFKSYLGIRSVQAIIGFVVVTYGIKLKDFWGFHKLDETLRLVWRVLRAIQSNLKDLPVDYLGHLDNQPIDGAFATRVNLFCLLVHALNLVKLDRVTLLKLMVEPFDQLYSCRFFILFPNCLNHDINNFF